MGPEGSRAHSLAVCKFKAHKRCAVRATNNCKWTTLASIGKDIIEDEDGVRLGGPPDLHGPPLFMLAPGQEDPPPPTLACSQFSSLLFWVASAMY